MTLRLLVVTVARCQLQDPHQAHLQSGIPLGDGAGVEVLPWLPGGRLQRGSHNKGCAPLGLAPSHPVDPKF
ncbi:hypothetical protein EOD39_16220 [Acipenser ruthenus]|uniref:Uncharacterized protein n=1 Tax=Acipenser ruthenus TaxID=7906 RepID=A0A444V6D9_ACIRT|nr:hypothetical protein EOD39_16220 [Acipenser ruthenus]